MHLHVPTLILVLVLMSFLLLILVGASAHRDQRDGTVYWVGALVLQATAYLLIYRSEQIGQTVAFLSSTVLRSCAWALFAEGIYQFYRLAPPRRLIWAPVAIVTVAFILLLDNLAPRITTVSLIFAFQCLLVLSLVWPKRHVTPGRGKYFLMTGLFIAVALLMMRAVAAMAGAAEVLVSLTGSSKVQSLTLLGVLGVLILLAFGFMLMSKDRSDHLNRTLATHDELTGLANRRNLNEVFAKEWARSMRSDQSLALAMIDIDHFKRYNDQYGHQAGDECLKLVAHTIELNARRTGDFAARYGGEEFLLILPDANVTVAQRLAENVRKSIETLNLPHIDSPTGRVTISVGIAARGSAAYKDAKSLLRAADQALYMAKNLGRNQVHVAEESRPWAGAGASAPVQLVQLIWRREYECGDPVIDAQHQALFSDANHLLSAVLQKRPASEMAVLVDSFVASIAQHFQDEEAAHRNAGYPDAAEHGNLHQLLLEKTVQLSRRFRSGTISIGELFEFLAHEVVASHILQSDRAYFGSIQPKG
jgi:diguanylate cyclase (GGDEF)-like protein/hemerythrin-like metal-binding protein